MGNMDVARDWGWAPDYVDAMWRILQQDTPDDYIIATGQTCTLRDFVAAVFCCLDLDWEQHVRHDPLLMRPADIAISSANPEKAAYKLGWRAAHTMNDVARLLVEAEKLRIINNPCS